MLLKTSTSLHYAVLVGNNEAHLTDFFNYFPLLLNTLRFPESLQASLSLQYRIIMDEK